LIYSILYYEISIFKSILYTLSMNISEWNNDEILRLVMAKGHITQKILLEMIKKHTGQDIPQSTFSCKIKRDGLKLSEFQNICKILGYEILLKRKT